jgi:hypothetical protein
MVTLQGCTVLQRAIYHKPSLEDTSIKKDRYGDGIVFVSDDVCIAARESIYSADYNNLLIGPLFVTVFPLGILEPGRLPPSPDFWLLMEITPLNKEIIFNPTEVEVEFNDGTRAAPWKVNIDRSSWKLIRNISNQVSIKNFRRFEFKFRKPTPESTVTRLSLKGLRDNGNLVPDIAFSLTTDYRFLLPGRFIDNTSSGTSEETCIKLKAIK